MTSRSALGFTAMITLAQAISNARSSEPKNIQAALRALDIPGNETIMPWTGIKFDDNGQNKRAQVVLQQLIGGRYRVVYPPRYALTDSAILPIAMARR